VAGGRASAAAEADCRIARQTGTTCGAPTPVAALRPGRSVMLLQPRRQSAGRRSFPCRACGQTAARVAIC